MPADSVLPYPDTKPVGHADFYFATNATFRFIKQRHGIEGLRRYETAAVPADTIVIHGANDETVPLANVLAWAEPLDLAVSVVPGTDHFFHRKLHLLRRIIESQWKH